MSADTPAVKASTEVNRGPLAGIRVVELAGMGPAPQAATMLADLGCDVVQIQRAGQSSSGSHLRGRRIVEADLKDAAHLESVLAVIDRADVLIEGFRPGVAERLGLGPEECCSRNSGLVYVRVTGWGQDGPRSQEAGHDLNYISLTGMLHAMGSPDASPPPPLNLLGDYAGGSMFAVVGVLAALVERGSSGCGQVVDAAIVDGVCSLAQRLWSLKAEGRWTDARGSNIFDGSAPFYRTYRCADGGYVAVAALEPPFFAELLQGIGVDPRTIGPQRSPDGWPAMHACFESVFASRTRDEWVATFAGTDACVTPVLSMSEAPEETHMRARHIFVDDNGTPQPAVAPRFSRTASPTPPPVTKWAHPLDDLWRES